MSVAPIKLRLAAPTHGGRGMTIGPEKQRRHNEYKECRESVHDLSGVV
jgi:hypothetical protein